MADDTTKKIQEGIESHLEGFPDLILVGEPRIKNVLQFSLSGRFDLIRAAEYLVAPKGVGLYSVDELNEFLIRIVPDEEYIGKHFPPETVQSVYDFRKIEQKPRKDSYVTIGKLVFRSKLDSEPIKVALSEGEFFVYPSVNSVKVDNGCTEFDFADSVRHGGHVMVYPHEEFARRSYGQAELNPPLDKITIMELKELKKNYNPNLIQRLLG